MIGPFFFCGIGGSGMLPLAMILNAQGVCVTGSDRSFDQGRSPDKKAWLEKQGIVIMPQDGEGLNASFEALVVSSAIEDTIPEVRKAKEIGVPIIKRADLLAKFFNQSKTSIAIGGTSGKSTTTGMAAWILSQADKNPTVMNGANFLNFVSQEVPFASALTGDPDLFVSECDESDGSIVLYHPTIAVLNNIALDHQPVAELVPVFRQFLDQSQKQVLNVSCRIIEEQIAQHYKQSAITYGIEHPSARLSASDYVPLAAGSQCRIEDRATGDAGVLTLQVAGKHNVENALAAISIGLLQGLSLQQCLNFLAGFKGIGRRLETVGKSNNIIVIDDFAHNPDKIRATLDCLNEHSGRLIIFFQMHGFGPLRLMKHELCEVFAKGLKTGDYLLMPEALYLGGTVDRSVTTRDFINEINERGAEKGLAGEWFETRQGALPRLIELASSGDRIVIMGARDDTLSDFAKDVLTGISKL